MPALARGFFLAIALLAVGSPVRGDELEKVAEGLRPLIVEHLPVPLYKKEKEWGRTSPTFSRIQWRGGTPKVVKVMKNDGSWRRWTVTARDPATQFTLKLAETPADAGQEGRGCRASVGMLVGVEFEHEIWENGIRLLSRTVRARMRIQAEFDYRVQVTFESKNGGLPEAVIRPKLANVRVGYNELVVEHMAGMGGTAAKLLGKAVTEILGELKPSLEEELLEKANKAVIKAANKQEIRVGLGKWLHMDGKK
jgi:hypothetical protein